VDFWIFRKCDMCGRWGLKKKNMWYRAKNVWGEFELPKSREEANCHICKACYARLRRRR